jgi:pterin-4a-carbinolamine dehydratase
VFQDFTPADKLDHHPECLNVYRLNVDENVEVTLSTDAAAA